MTDRVGSGSLTIDDGGFRLSHKIFAPFGRVHAHGWSEETDAVFATHLYEESVELHYMKARWYDPASGRFASVDPVVSDLADPQTHNSYGYVRNNPVNGIDPSGRGEEEEAPKKHTGQGGSHYSSGRDFHDTMSACRCADRTSSTFFRWGPYSFGGGSGIGGEFEETERFQVTDIGTVKETLSRDEQAVLTGLIIATIRELSKMSIDQLREKFPAIAHLPDAQIDLARRVLIQQLQVSAIEGLKVVVFDIVAGGMEQTLKVIIFPPTGTRKAAEEIAKKIFDMGVRMHEMENMPYQIRCHVPSTFGGSCGAVRVNR